MFWITVAVEMVEVVADFLTKKARGILAIPEWDDFLDLTDCLALVNICASRQKHHMLLSIKGVVHQPM